MNGNTPMTRQGFAQVIAELIVDLYNCAVVCVILKLTQGY
jgi:hypothetical protein